MEPTAVIQCQLDAFNARDIETLLAVYADDAEMYEHPSKLVARGSAELRDCFTARFREANLHATLVHRIVAGTTVIDHENVRRTFPDGEGELQLVMIYEVKDDRIAKAWSVAGTKTLDPKR